MAIINSGKVEIEVDGVTYEANYTVWKDVVTVEHNGQSKSTQEGGLPPDDVARLLLAELVGSGT